MSPAVAPDERGMARRMMTAAAAFFGRIWKSLWPAYRRKDFRKYCASARSLRCISTPPSLVEAAQAFGATPGNIATQLNLPGKVAVVAGVNLPMLLRTLCYREGTLAATVDKALAGGTQGVMQVASTAVQNQNFKPQGDDHARIHDQQ